MANITRPPQLGGRLIFVREDRDDYELKQGAPMILLQSIQSSRPTSFVSAPRGILLSSRPPLLASAPLRLILAPHPTPLRPVRARSPQSSQFSAKLLSQASPPPAAASLLRDPSPRLAASAEAVVSAAVAASPSAEAAAAGRGWAATLCH